MSILSRLDNPSSEKQTGEKQQNLTHATIPLLRPSDLTGLSSTNETQISWDHLLRYQALEDKTIIDFATPDDDQNESESEDDEDEDEDSSTEENLHVEQEGDMASWRTQAQCTLSVDEIVDIINERIEFYTESWHMHIDDEDYLESSTDPAELWERADASGLRESLARKYEHNYHYYQQRLDNLCEEITKYPGKSANSVRQQCRNLQITVGSMEFACYLASIYKSKNATSIVSHMSQMDHTEQTDRMDRLPISESRTINEIQAHPSLEKHLDRPIQILEEHVERRQRFQSPDSVIPGSSEPVEGDISAVNQAFHRSPMEKHSDEPEHASIATVSRWDWMDLVATRDRKRVTSKLVNNMDSQDREHLRLWLAPDHKASMSREISGCIDMLLRSEPHIRGELPRNSDIMVTLTKLFLSWWLCDNYAVQEPSKLDLEQTSQCLKRGSSDITTFYNYMCTIMATTFHKDALMHPDRPSQAEIIEISDDED